MAEKNVKISKPNFKHIFERSMSENLKKGQVSITYEVLQDIFSIIEDSDGSERSLSLSNICDIKFKFILNLFVWQRCS